MCSHRTQVEVALNRAPGVLLSRPRRHSTHTPWGTDGFLDTTGSTGLIAPQTVWLAGDMLSAQEWTSGFRVETSA